MLLAESQQWAEKEIRHLLHGMECNAAVIGNLLSKPTHEELIAEMHAFPNDRVPKYFEKVQEFATELFARRKREAKKARKEQHVAAVAQQKKAEANFPQLKPSATVVNPNRRVCLCQGMQHGAMGNCLNCGKINCVQEGPGPCLFCDTELTHIVSPDEALRKAIKMKDRLVKSGTNSKNRTKVYDDAADAFSETANPWLTRAQRDHLEKEGKRLEEEKLEERRKVHLTFDVYGRQLVELPLPSAARKEQERLDFENYMESTVRTEQQSDVHGGVNPQLLGPSKDLYNALKSTLGAKGSTKAVSSTSPAQAVKVESEFDSVHFVFSTPGNAFKPIWGDDEDEGKVLSLHQPCASLIVHGFKRAEGRNWKTAYRGRLWIHAAAKEPDQETIVQMETFYEGIYADAGIDIPKLPSKTNGYPTSCLLGCVDFTQCWPQEEYTDVLRQNPKMPREESECDHVFFVHNPRRCVVPFPLSGDHKIWTLSKKWLPDYQNSLVPVVWQQPIALPNARPVSLDLWPTNTGKQKLQTVRSGMEAWQELLLDGCVVLKNFINLEAQQKLIDLLRDMGIQENGWYCDHFAGGQKASVLRLSIGGHWDASTGHWVNTRADGSINPPIPDELVELYKLSVIQSSNILPKKSMPFPPDGKCEMGIVNFYHHQAKLGIHQDKHESQESIRRGDPVVSICLGDDCDFSFSMEPPGEVKPKIARLKSGDALIFGGVARLMWHGVHRIIPHTSPPELNLIPGRLSITLRCR